MPCEGIHNAFCIVDSPHLLDFLIVRPLARAMPRVGTKKISNAKKKILGIANVFVKNNFKHEFKFCYILVDILKKNIKMTTC
jgi:hypothetical protein